MNSSRWAVGAWIVSMSVVAGAVSLMPQSLLPVVEQVRAEYPAANLTPDQLGELVNEVARRAGGPWGTLDKPSGTNCPLPVSGRRVACDVVFNRETGHHYDILVASEETAIPSWQDNGLAELSRWIAPETPGGEPLPDPLPPPVPPIPPVPPDQLTEKDLLVRIELLLIQINQKLDRPRQIEMIGEIKR